MQLHLFVSKPYQCSVPVAKKKRLCFELFFLNLQVSILYFYTSNS